MPAQAALWRTDRYLEALRAVYYLTQAEEIVYSPIVHFHDVAAKFKLRTDAEYWTIQNQIMIYSARRVIVLKNDGWDTSKGVRNEVRMAKQAGKPVFWCNLLSDRITTPFE